MKIKRKETPEPTEEGWYYAQKRAELGYTGCPVQPTRVEEGIPLFVMEWGGMTGWALSDYRWYGPVDDCEVEA